MTSLVIRPSGLEEKHNKPWSLCLRERDSVETNYTRLCFLTDEGARAVIEAGAPYWLFGEPDWENRFRKRELERARVLREEAAAIEAKNQQAV